MNKLIEFKIGDKVRYVGDAKRSMVGTITWVSEDLATVTVEWGSRYVVSHPRNQQLCLDKTNERIDLI